MADASLCEVCRDDNGGERERRGGEGEDDHLTVRASHVCEQCCLRMCQACTSLHTSLHLPSLTPHLIHPLTPDTPLQLPWPENGKKKVSPKAANKNRDALKDRVQKIKDRASRFEVQADHVTNEFRAMRLGLQETFSELHRLVEERQHELSKLLEEREERVVSSLRQVGEERRLLKLTACSVGKAANAAPDDVLVAMTKALTLRLDDVEKRPDVASGILPRAERLSFDKTALAQLTALIGDLGHFQQENAKAQGPFRIPRSSKRVPLPGGPGFAVVREFDESEKPTGAALVRQLAIGHRVKRSDQWRSGNKDGGPGTLGTVRHVGTHSVLQGLTEVTWDSGSTCRHRMGRDGVYELQLA